MKYEKKVKISSKVKEEEKKEEEKPKYKYTADQIKEMLQDGYNKLSEVEAWEEPMGTLTTMVISQKTINTDNNTFTGTWTYDDNKSYTCTYNYVTNNMSCENFTEAQNYVKATCDNMHNDYLNYLETGEIENEDAKEWENLYSDMNSCYFEAIPSNEPTDFKEDIQKAIDTFQKNHIKTIMLTGDRKSIAEDIAKKIGIEEYYAELLPQEKSKPKIIISQPQFKNNYLYIGEYKIKFRKNTISWCMLKAVFNKRTNESDASSDDIFELEDEDLAQSIVGVTKKEIHRYYAMRNKVNNRISKVTGIKDEFIEVNNTYFKINKDFGL